MTWTDPRTPVSVTWVGKFKVTVYDQAAYDESLRMYPSEPNVSRRRDNFPDKPVFAKQKPQKRYNWIVPLEKPLTGRTEQKERTA